MVLKMEHLFGKIQLLGILLQRHGLDFVVGDTKGRRSRPSAYMGLLEELRYQFLFFNSSTYYEFSVIFTNILRNIGRFLQNLST
jgi:hypothetical protein